MIALFECLLCESIPAFWAIDSSSHLHCYIEVATFNGEIEAGIFILDKMQRNL
jgi:meiotically up-regulated gene 157 (Mug157) protein